MTGPVLLRRHLRVSGRTQEELSIAAGIAQPTISQLLSGKRGAGLRVAQAIERATAGDVPAESWLRRRTRAA